MKRQRRYWYRVSFVHDDTGEVYDVIEFHSTCAGRAFQYATSRRVVSFGYYNAETQKPEDFTFSVVKLRELTELERG